MNRVSIAQFLDWCRIFFKIDGRLVLIFGWTPGQHERFRIAQLLAHYEGTVTREMKIETEAILSRRKDLSTSPEMTERARA